MLLIAGYAHVKADLLDGAVAAAAAMASASRAEEGCIDYRFSIDIEDPNLVRIIEQWESQAALDAHFQTAHFDAFASVIADVVDGPSGFTRHEVASSGPLFG